MGDFNHQIGKWEIGELKISIGSYQYERRDENGERVVEFCNENHLRKKHSRRWTWISSNMETKKSDTLHTLDRDDESNVTPRLLNTSPRNKLFKYVKKNV